MRKILFSDREGWKIPGEIVPSGIDRILRSKNFSAIFGEHFPFFNTETLSFIAILCLSYY